MKELTLHSFEAGRRGKPDEFESQIANIIGAIIMGKDDNARFDLRINGGFSKTNDSLFLNITGEISDTVVDDGFKTEILDAVQAHYKLIYREELPKEAIHIDLTAQSTALNENGVNKKSGDSGVVIAVASKNSPLLLPWERYIAVEIRDILDEIYLGNDRLITNKFLESHREDSELTLATQRLSHVIRADGKIEVNALYHEGYKLDSLRNVTVAIEHSKGSDLEQIRVDVRLIIHKLLEHLENEFKITLEQPEIFINTAGDWPIGGWITDAGTREGKPYRDGFSSHGTTADSFSGEDPSKPEGTGTLIARKIAVDLIKNGHAEFAKVTLAYQIGLVKPIVNIFTHGTSTKSQEELEAKISDETKLSLYDVATEFNMRSFEHYKKLAEISDYFHSDEFGWNN